MTSINTSVSPSSLISTLNDKLNKIICVKSIRKRLEFLSHTRSFSYFLNFIFLFNLKNVSRLNLD